MLLKMKKTEQPHVYTCNFSRGRGEYSTVAKVAGLNQAAFGRGDTPTYLASQKMPAEMAACHIINFFT